MANVSDEFSLEAVASACGMTRRGKRWGPSPCCGKKSAGRRDRRAPVVVTGQRWMCTCGCMGDAIDLAGYHLFGEQPRGEDFIRALEWLRSGSMSVAEPFEPEPIRRINPMEALLRSKRISEVVDQELEGWLFRRRIDKTAPAGWLVGFRADWWPSGYDKYWPLVIPACSGRGKVESIHGIAVSEHAPRKTTWPKGASSSELLFADKSTRSFLSGADPKPRRILFVEGATDYLTAATAWLEGTMVIGVSSGSARALRLLPSLEGVSLFAGTDPDRTGDRYAREVADALFPHAVRRLPLKELVHGHQ